MEKIWVFGNIVTYRKEIIKKRCEIGYKMVPEKGHKLDIKYLEIPEIFSQNRTIFDDILAKNVTWKFGAKLFEFGAKLHVSLM